VSESAPDDRLLEALQARARSEADSVVALATIRQTGWGDALRLYAACFTDAAKQLLARAELARARREGR